MRASVISRVFSESYLCLHGFEFGTTNVAEFSQWIVSVRSPGLNLLGRQVRLRVGADDLPYNCLGIREYVR